MKTRVLLFLILGLAASRGQDGFIKKFSIPLSDIKLIRTAQSSQYFDKIGRKAAVMGSEAGNFELWVWPWKPLRNFDLHFFTENSTSPIRSEDIVKDITVLPEATIINYSYESFSVKEIIFIPVDEPAAVILLDVNTVIPLSIVPGFIPVMQPQWPAGIGGQYSYWDENINAYIISESQQRGLFLCGSPLGIKMTEPPAHMFADNSIQFRINITREDAPKGYIPIVIAGYPVKTKFDSVKTLYKRIFKTIPELFQKNVTYYRNLRDSSITIQTPLEKINLAFEWGKVGLRNLLVENPVLGKGLVAGYGLSGNGGRAGFSWFFGGDAFINSLAMNSYQDFSTVKDALSFTQKWQRQEEFPIRKRDSLEVNDVGKIAHELSQSDGLVDWWNDYHFGYNHADTTPWYLVAMGDYYRNSGDSEFIKKSWESIKQAFNWCLSKDSNDDGLMDLKGAGLGVLEFGSLVNIHNDIYTQSLWTQGLKELMIIAELTGDNEIKTQAEELLSKALASLEKIYWMKYPGFYSFGANEQGKQVQEKSIYSSAALFFKLLDEDNSVSTLKKFNTSEMITSWGVRNISSSSELYNPSNYNYGTVWPFTSFMIGTSEFNYNFNIQGYQILNNTINNIFNYGLGVAPEVLSGDLNTKLSEAYHNQGFSYSGFILPLIKGLFGIEVNSLNNEIKISPKFPADWDSVKISNIKVHSNYLSFNYQKTRGKFKLLVENSGNEKIQMNYQPNLPPGIYVTSLLVNGKSHPYEAVETKYHSAIESSIPLTSKTEIEVSFEPVPEVFFIPSEIPLGSISNCLIINSQEYSKRRLKLNLEVYDGETYFLGITNPELIKKITGGVLQDNIIIISSDQRSGNSYRSKEILIEFNNQ